MLGFNPNKQPKTPPKPMTPARKRMLAMKEFYKQQKEASLRDRERYEEMHGPITAGWGGPQSGLDVDA
jgi:hypothetical protein